MKHFGFLLRIALVLAFGSRAGSADAQFQHAPSTHARIRQEAHDAPLKMQFVGGTADELAAWQKEFTAKLRSLLGPYDPPKTWNVIVEERQELDGFTRERLVLQADGHPSLPLYRLLPRPLPKKACPAVLALHGHSGVYPVVGLTEKDGAVTEAPDNHYDYGRRLARRGFVVAAPCMTPFTPREPKDGYRANEDRCAIAFVRLQLLGKLLIAENLRDCLWSLELLAQDPQVDAKRLGCVGLSYGGRMAMLTTALDRRIQVAGISGACNVLQERILARYSCGAQVVPGLLLYGDVPEIGSLIAPRPCVWEIGSNDRLIDPVWAERALERIGRAYRAAGALDKLQVDRFDGDHIWNGRLAMPLLESTLTPGM